MILLVQEAGMNSGMETSQYWYNTNVCLQTSRTINSVFSFTSLASQWLRLHGGVVQILGSGSGPRNPPTR